MIRSCIYIVLLLFSMNCFAGSKVRKKNPANVHVISIGINNYGQYLDNLEFENCASDATRIVKKINKDFTPQINRIIARVLDRDTLTKISRDSIIDKLDVKVHSHLLLNQEATLDNIKRAFKEVIKNSTSDDYFVFYFAGFTVQVTNQETIIVPYESNLNDIDYKNYIKNYKKYDNLHLKELAQYMNQISANKQLIITESGSGSDFVENLQAALFESNVDIAMNIERERIILSTIGWGQDSSKCARNMGPLMKYIEDSGNVLDVFHGYLDYEYKLNKSELNCSPNNSRYYYLAREKNYTKMLSRHFNKQYGTRGSLAKNIKTKKSEKGDSEVYGLIIATNEYNNNQTSWGNLKNPINDANAISDVLESKFSVKVKKLYNKTRSVIEKGVIELKHQMDENDKLLVFIAGHGYFSEDYGQGYLVTTDCVSLEDENSLSNYLPMNTLYSLLDSFSSKQIFTVFDVCYGASFELNGKEIPVENYVNTTFDNGIEKYIEEVDKSYARIMMASGQYEVFDYWKDSQKHSPFADKFIKALNKEKDFISPGKIFSYVRGNATTPILKRFGKHEVTGDFLLKVK